VRDGADARLPPVRDHEAKRLRVAHDFVNVYREMLFQICLNYSAVPDFRTLTLSQIRFLYDGLRPTLRAHTKPRNPT
jgi:hypothetical protein